MSPIRGLAWSTDVDQLLRTPHGSVLDQGHLRASLVDRSTVDHRHVVPGGHRDVVVGTLVGRLARVRVRDLPVVVGGRGRRVVGEVDLEVTVVHDRNVVDDVHGPIDLERLVAEVDRVGVVVVVVAAGNGHRQRGGDRGQDPELLVVEHGLFLSGVLLVLHTRHSVERVHGQSRLGLSIFSEAPRVEPRKRQTQSELRWFIFLVVPTKSTHFPEYLEKYLITNLHTLSKSRSYLARLNKTTFPHKEKK